MKTYGVTEVATQLGLSKETIYKLIKEDRLSCSKIGLGNGRKVKFIISEHDIENFLEENRIGAKDKV